MLKYFWPISMFFAYLNPLADESVYTEKYGLNISILKTPFDAQPVFARECRSIMKMRKYFEDADTDKSGALDRDELVQISQKSIRRHL